MRTTIDMAREAGIDEWWDNGGDWRETFNEHLKAFEALVRADERNELAKHFEQAKQAGIHTDWVAAPVQQILSAFPLFDEGLDQEEHHCEWTLQQDRKRLHAMLAHGITGKGGAA